MKVLLINPPRKNEIIGNNPTIIEEERGYNPPLGLLYIAGYLEKYSDHQIKIIDAQVEELNYQALEEQVDLFKPDIVGLTAMTMTLLDVIKTVEIVKKVKPDAKIVLGGPHVHLYPNESINLSNIDFLVLGEGEKTFKLLLDNISNFFELEKIPGLVFKNNGQIINTGIPEPINNLDDLPFPARHLVPYKKYNSLLSKGSCVTTVFTSRGCPFQCSFCDRPHLGKKFRARTANNVVDELEECVKMGIKDFLVYDDTFTVDKQRTIDICDEIVNRDLKINWDIRSRVDTITEDMLVKLKKAGCCGIHYGVEAGTEKILKVLNKGITIDQVKKTFDLTRKYKIPILAYFMIGSPEETKEDILTNFDVMKKLKPDFVHMTILTPFPGTKIYFNGLASGIIKKDYWQEFAANPEEEFVPPHWDEIFTREELNELLVQGYKSFYMRPQYILKRILKLRNWNEFKKKAKAGLKVFSMKSAFQNQNSDTKSLNIKYAEERVTKKSFRYRLWRRTEEVLQVIKQSYSGKVEAILDLGTADARMLSKIQQNYPNASCVGVEYDQSLADFVRKKYPQLKIVQGDVQLLKFPDNYFDIVICTAVLEHVPNPLKVLKEANRTLKPGGIVIATSPHPFWESLTTGLGLLDEEQHHKTMNLKELKAISIEAGLEVIKAEKFMLFGLGLPFEFYLEKLLKKFKLDFFYINQLLVCKKKDNSEEILNFKDKKKSFTHDQKKFWEQPKKRREPTHPVIQEFAVRKTDYIKKVIRNNQNYDIKSILDVGAGSGFFSYYFEKEFDTTALDFSQSMLEINPCQKKILGDAENLPFKDNSFDIVFCSNLLHHLENPQKAVNEMKRVSKKYIVLSEPNRNNLLMLLFGLLKKEERALLRFSIKHLNQLIQNSNLQIIDSSSQGIILPNKTPLFLLPYLKRFNGKFPLAFFNIVIAQK